MLPAINQETNTFGFLDHEWLTFGRLRPLHTNAVIFAFAGNAIFAAVYYSTPRLPNTHSPPAASAAAP